jgi:predicted DCC family thiol-disulfide oxidoreductase YuxK
MKFLINRDKNLVFRIGFLNDNDSHKSMDSIVLVYKDKTYTKSTAVLKSICLLGGVYQLASVFYCMPKFIRDIIYTIIATHRYKWFGKLDQCPTMPEEWKKRMINYIQ